MAMPGFLFRWHVAAINALVLGGDVCVWHNNTVVQMLNAVADHFSRR